ncbi:MAG TPA: MFS transporter [Bacteroidia bacterium]|nr:MFS transporter [Bacteroidia bacterium]
MQKDPIASLRIADFRFFIAARLFMTLATQMQAVVVGWQIYEHTKNPFWLGMIGLTEAIPFISSALFAGHIADIIERKKIILYSTFALVICTGLLCAFTFNKSSILFQYGIWPVYGVIFISGIARAFTAPSFFAFMSQIVPREQYSNASTWSSTVWQIGAVGGPAIGGLLYGLIGITNTYAIDFVLLLVACACFMFIAARPLAPRQVKEPLAESLAKGVRFVFQNEEILGALTLDLFAVFFGGAVALLPIFADKILMVGPIGLGLLRAAPSVGAVVMATIMVYWPPLKNAGRNMLFAVAGFGVCMILFAISTNVYLSLFLLALSGAFDSVSVIIRSTILQLMTPDEMRGRVASVNNIFIGSSNEIGEFESGMAARFMRLVPSVIFGGSMTILVVAYTSFKAKKLRRLQLHNKV